MHALAGDHALGGGVEGGETWGSSSSKRQDAGGEEKVRRKEEVSDPKVGCKLRAHEVAEGSSSGRMRAHTSAYVSGRGFEVAEGSSSGRMRVREVRHLGAAGGAAEEEVRRKEEERIAEGLDESTQVLDLTKLYLSSI